MGNVLLVLGISLAVTWLYSYVESIHGRRVSAYTQYTVSAVASAFICAHVFWLGVILGAINFVAITGKYWGDLFRDPSPESDVEG